MKVCLIVKPGHENSGVGRYAATLCSALERAGMEVVITHPIAPFPGWFFGLIKQVLGLDLLAFFNTYPILVNYQPADVYHFTSQNLATLLWLCRPRGPVVITVHDLIPWETRNTPDLSVYKNWFLARFDRLALGYLSRMRIIISDTEYTAGVFRRACPEYDGVIQTIPLAVD
jgi:hypothetical protein